ncbi:MAG TPA: lipoyl(octanoyl) transferase LipB [Chthoniobacteraceae bacterium]|nr:lipoyl(octanoyl) transferase LipB [Chthoniobacteraceae bacterium]
MKVEWLGRIAFDKAFALQQELVERKAANRGEPDRFLLLEHEPVYTIGRTPDRSSLRDPAQLPHAVVQINRGGQATYHGPGQLIGYPIIDLRRQNPDLHKYLRALEEIVIVLLESYGISATRRDSLTGVWVTTRKIASIGVGLRKWITMHGFALNVCGDLSPFNAITPCGIAGVEMTSIERELGVDGSVQVEDVVARMAQQLDPVERISQLFPRAAESAHAPS